MDQHPSRLHALLLAGAAEEVLCRQLLVAARSPSLTECRGEGGRKACPSVLPNEVSANDACLMPQGIDETRFPLYVPRTSRTQRLSVDSESLNATEELDIL